MLVSESDIIIIEINYFNRQNEYIVQQIIYPIYKVEVINVGLISVVRFVALACHLDLVGILDYLYVFCEHYFCLF